MKIEDHQLLREGAHGFGVTLSERQLYLFALFLEGLRSWNRRMNLTGISEKREMIVKLLLDPLVALPYLSSSGTVLDIGSGAGIPGMPFKIARPEFEVHLIESKGKKVSFLRDMIRRLGLKGVEAYKGRAEKRDGLPTLFNSYDIVTARALAPLKKTIGICSPYLEPGSLLVTFKGSRVDQEIEDSEELMGELNFRISKKIPYSLPETEGERYLLILEKE
ncbi:MAG: 16S rRNA (guanine(527)-N(7))-methyltransferase RsmG [Deltaproteobacteria bacterium]|nr:MAG: 16S rRNA (guanine(527)-N(7))-methyltransferase RsmG [Deltaproteobacteria bacterium]